jgi:hypothetical protein
VVDNLSVVGGVVHWNVLFTRYAQDWEVEMVMSSMNSYTLLGFGMGRLIGWCGIFPRGGILK